MYSIPLFAMGSSAGYGAGRGWYCMGQFFGMPVGGLLSLVVLVLAVYLVVRMTRSGRDRQSCRPDAPAGETPLDILKRRYAAGEIDAETFERMKRDLQ